MIIQCKKCKSKYKIDEWRVKPAGSKVRCSKCGHIFFVMIDEEPGADSDSQLRKGLSSESFEDGSEGRAAFENEYRHVEKNEDSSKSMDFAQTARSSTKESGETSQGQKDLKNGSEKGSEEAFNWGDLIDVDRDEEASFETSENRREFSQKEDNLEFNWKNIDTDREIPETVDESPQLFNESTDEVVDNSSKKRPDLDQEIESVEPTLGDTLSIDTEGLQFAQQRVIRPNPSFTDTEQFTSYKPRRQSSSSSRGVLKKLVSTLFTILIFVVMVGAGVVIAMNLDIIPKDKSQKIASLVLSKLPLGFIRSSRNADIVVSNQDGRWMSTSNGYTYVVSGRVTNGSDSVVNYIRLKSEFMSGGDKLFEQVAYAGNTFTEEELETLSLAEIKQKLQRKNGDIDFRDAEKLAGLNFNIKPGQSVPFFSIFPAESKILGLKYDVEVVDFEKSYLE